jgi:hypothetical protein
VDREHWIRFVGIAVLGLVLAACSASAEEQEVASLATPTPTHTPAPATIVPTATTPPEEVTATATASPGCTVQVSALNLRSGPGTVFEPPLVALAQGTELEPLGFSAVGFPEDGWITVRVRQSGQTGWVSASPQLVDCDIDLASLPPADPPPTPTAAPTSTAAPTPTTAPTPTAAPTPPRVLLAFVPVDGGGDEVLNLRNSNPIKDGRNITLPGFAQAEITEPMVFRDRIAFQVEVFDKNRGNADGQGIQQVEFTIRDGDEIVHERTERNAGYCAFGGGEPDCAVWVFHEHGNTWPMGQYVREGMLYDVNVHIVADSGDTADWMWSFEVDLP